MHTVALELGVAVGSVYNYLKKYGIKSKSVRDYPISQQRMENAKLLGMSRKGAHLTDETKAKISISKKGKFRKPSKYGGCTKTRNDGYIAVFVPNHPYCNSEGFVMEHRLVMEESIGRYLLDNEVVHHINHKRADNRIENLKLMTFDEHSSFHMKERHNKRRNDLSTVVIF